MRSHRKLRSLALGGCLAAVLVGATAAGAVSDTNRTHAATSETIDVKIAYISPVALCVLPQIAIDKGFFPSNVHVTFQNIAGAAILAPLATGSIQFALTGAPVIDLGVAGSGAPISWLAEWNDPPDNQLVGRPGINSVKDLAGKAVAISSPGTLSAILTNAALHEGGLNSGFTQLALGPLQNSISAFANGTVSAVISSPPTTAQLLSRVPGSKVLYDFYPHKDFPWVGMGIAGYMPWVKKHPTTTVAILSALNRALKVVHNDPAFTKSEIKKLSGLTDQGDIDDSYRALDARSFAQLAPVSLTTERNILSFLRQNKFDAKASLASSLTTSTYVNRLPGSK
jgi:ABC-type nitrate/sulfonate/bicarbonate transport system substrate-binding protein